MSIIGLAIITLAKVIHLILNIYSFIVLGAVIISWFRPDPYNPIVSFLNQVTEPIFQLIRKRMPASFSSTGLDFTPVIVFIAIIVLDTFLVGLLMDTGMSLRHGGLNKMPMSPGVFDQY